MTEPLPLPTWFRRLIDYYASGSARMFVLHFNVDDYVLNPYATQMPVTRVIPLLQDYVRRHLPAKSTAFSAIFRYSHSLDVSIDDRQDEVLARISDVMHGILSYQPQWSPTGLSRGTAPAQPQPAYTSFGSSSWAPAATAPVVGGAGAPLGGSVGDRVANDVYASAVKHVKPLTPPDQVLRVLERILVSQEQRSLVVIEHVENLAPRDNAQGDQLLNAEILRRLATDYQFRNSDNLCILITRDLSAIDAGIFAPGTNCFPIQIDLPDQDERRRFLNTMDQANQQEQAVSSTGPQANQQEHAGTADGPQTMLRGLISGLADIDATLKVSTQAAAGAERARQIDILAQLTQGFRLVEIDQLNRQVRAQHLAETARTRQLAGQPFGAEPERPMIRLDSIKEHKRRAIQEQSGGLLEIIDVQRGFNAIGGMEVIKRYLKVVSDRVLRSATDPGYLHLIPRGIVLAGPPGTGKTIIAEALAFESGLNMVKLRNIRQQWVGASERNLTRAFEVIRALSPILVFVDEIDQAFGGRGVGQSSDGGTSERMFGQILEFIGDDRNRGRVVWIAATNRPDSLDAALLRRFDRIIPCLLPSPNEQLRILAALPHTISKLRYDDELRQLIDANSEQILSLFANKEGMVPTGAVIEAIARRAVECAGDRAAGTADTSVTLSDMRAALADYRSNARQTEYDYQSLLAIHACNFYSVMPELPNRAPFTEIIEPRSAEIRATDPEGNVIPEFWRTNVVAYTSLTEQLRSLRLELGSALREEGR